MAEFDGGMGIGKVMRQVSEGWRVKGEGRYGEWTEKLVPLPLNI